MKQKRIKSEKARLDALNKMRDEQMKSQEIIQQALKAATIDQKNDGNPNHIVFESSDEDEVAENSKKAFSDALGFGDDGNDILPVDELSTKPQFEGKKGMSLMKLQTRIGYDKRFELDERFLDELDDEEEDDNEDENEKDLEKQDMKAGGGSKTAVGGKKRVVQFVDINQKRYDPSQSGHEKFKIKAAPDPKEEEEEPIKKKKKMESGTPMPAPDAECFYKADFNQLTKIFGSTAKQQGEDDEKEETDKETTKEKEPAPFSFASMFGQMNNEDGKEEKQQLDEEDEMQVDETSSHQQQDSEAPSSTSRLPNFTHFTDDDEFSSDDPPSEDEEEEHRKKDGSSTKEQSDVKSSTSAVAEDEFFQASNKILSKHAHRGPFFSQDWLDEITKLVAGQPVDGYETRRDKWLEQKDELREDYKKKRKDFVREKKRQTGFHENDD